MWSADPFLLFSSWKAIITIVMLLLFHDQSHKLDLICLTRKYQYSHTLILIQLGHIRLIISWFYWTIGKIPFEFKGRSLLFSRNGCCIDGCKSSYRRAASEHAFLSDCLVLYLWPTQPQAQPRMKNRVELKINATSDEATAIVMAFWLCLTNGIPATACGNEVVIDLIITL